MWRLDDSEVWALEQQCVSIPLKEWVLMDPDVRPKTERNGNTVYNAIIKNWANCQQLLSPGQSLLSSVIYHPKFKIAVTLGDFHRWEEVGLDKFGAWRTKSSILSAMQVIDRMGYSMILIHQFIGSFFKGAATNKRGFSFFNSF